MRIIFSGPSPRLKFSPQCPIFRSGGCMAPRAFKQCAAPTFSQLRVIDSGGNNLLAVDLLIIALSSPTWTVIHSPRAQPTTPRGWSLASFADHAGFGVRRRTHWPSAGSSYVSAPSPPRLVLRHQVHRDGLTERVCRSALQGVSRRKKSEGANAL